MMKKTGTFHWYFLPAAAVTALVFAFSGQFPKGEAIAGSGEASAILDIPQQVSVQAMNPSVNVNYTGSGELEVTFDFMVESNSPEVDMFLSATNFYRNWDMSQQENHTVPLLESSNVIFDVDAEAVGGKTTAAFIEQGEPIDGHPSMKTETLTFRDRSGEQFSQQVTAAVVWDQDDPHKASGQYIAKVKLTCLLTP